MPTRKEEITFASPLDSDKQHNKFGVRYLQIINSVNTDISRSQGQLPYKSQLGRDLLTLDDFIMTAAATKFRSCALSWLAKLAR